MTVPAVYCVVHDEPPAAQVNGAASLRTVSRSTPRATDTLRGESTWHSRLTWKPLSAVVCTFHLAGSSVDPLKSSLNVHRQ